jgi:hypothetical protein
MAKKRQAFLPGTEPVKNAKVHPRAINYADARDARMECNRIEKEAHDDLLATMLEEGLEVYEYGDIKVTVNNKRKCRVEDKTRKHESNGDDDE